MQIDHTLRELGQLKETDGENQRLLKSDITHGLSQFKEHHITKCPEKDIISVKEKFISNLIENIENRFVNFIFYGKYCEQLC